MATALSLNPENKSSYFLSHIDGIESEISDRLPMPMRKVPIKDVLNRRMKEAGIPNAAELSRRTRTKNRYVSETGIKAILQGKTQDPGISTADNLAITMDVSTLRFIAEMLGIDPDDPALKAEDFRVAHEIYRDLTPAQQQKANAYVSGLLGPTLQLRKFYH